jgi:flavodoxin
MVSGPGWRRAMRVLVVYDSKYGNTERIARAIAEGIGGAVENCGTVTADHIQGLDLLVVGSPTQGGRPTAALKSWIDGIPDDAVSGVAAAAFDTRLSAADCGALTRFVIKVIGFAAPRIASSLRSRGAEVVTPPEGFVVTGKEGPLKAGEVLRAQAWALRLLGIAATANRAA